MNFGGSRFRDEPEISLTSLIDVVFTLIIFFVVGGLVLSRVDEEEGVRVARATDAAAMASPADAIPTSEATRA